MSTRGYSLPSYIPVTAYLLKIHNDVKINSAIHTGFRHNENEIFEIFLAWIADATK